MVRRPTEQNISPDRGESADLAGLRYLVLDARDGELQLDSPADVATAM
jgi:hypothetical protein